MHTGAQGGAIQQYPILLPIHSGQFPHPRVLIEFSAAAAQLFISVASLC